MRPAAPEATSLSHFSDGAAETVHEAAGRDDIMGCRDHGLGAVLVEGDRLFDQQMDPGLACQLDLSIMGKGRQGNDQEVEPFVR